MIKTRKIKRIITELIKGYILVLKSIFFKVDYKKFDLPVKISTAIIILGLIGLLRSFISILFGIKFFNGVYFTFDLGALFTMFVFPIFLCFFPAMIITSTFKLWNFKINPKNIIGFFFFMQFVHILIPFLEWLQFRFCIPCSFPISPPQIYLKLAISPLALTPLIFFVTNACTLGINTAWVFASIATIKYGMNYKVPLKRFLFVSMIIFYIIYVISYPAYLLFYSQGNNFYYAMTYLVGTIGAILYFKSKILT